MFCKIWLISPLITQSNLVYMMTYLYLTILDYMKLIKDSAYNLKLHLIKRGWNSIIKNYNFMPWIKIWRWTLMNQATYYGIPSNYWLIEHQKSRGPVFVEPEQLPEVPYELPLDPSTGAWFRHSKTNDLRFCSFIEYVVASRITGTFRKRYTWF